MAMLAGFLRPVVRKTSKLAPSLASILRMDLEDGEVKEGRTTMEYQHHHDSVLHESWHTPVGPAGHVEHVVGGVQGDALQVGVGAVSCKWCCSSGGGWVLVSRWVAVYCC